MKKESISKKLRFKKTFVANLSKNEQGSLLGGVGNKTELGNDTCVICDRTWCSLDHTCAVGCEKEAATGAAY